MAEFALKTRAAKHAWSFWTAGSKLGFREWVASGPCLRQLGRHLGAFEMNHRVLQIRVRTLGPENEDTLTSMNNEGFYA